MPDLQLMHAAAIVTLVVRMDRVGTRIGAGVVGAQPASTSITSRGIAALRALSADIRVGATNRGRPRCRAGLFSLMPSVPGDREIEQRDRGTPR